MLEVLDDVINMWESLCLSMEFFSLTKCNAVKNNSEQTLKIATLWKSHRLLGILGQKGIFSRGCGDLLIVFRSISPVFWFCS